MRPRRALLAFGCTVLAGGAPAAATPLFVGLGDLPGGSVESRAAGISGDGTTVVGFSSSAASGAGAFTEVFRWTASQGMQGLGIVGPNPASAVSADGSVVVGTIWSGGFQVYRWTEPSGLQPIYVGQGKDVSADGSVVVGDTFRWSATTGLAFLGDLPGGIDFTLARAVSAAGDIVVGSAFSAAGQEAFRWTASTGMVGLGDLPGGAVKANANGISADGSTLVGDGEIDGGKSVPFLWTEAGGFVAGHLPRECPRRLGRRLRRGGHLRRLRLRVGRAARDAEPPGPPRRRAGPRSHGLAPRRRQRDLGRRARDHGDRAVPGHAAGLGRGDPGARHALPAGARPRDAGPPAAGARGLSPQGPSARFRAPRAPGREGPLERHPTGQGDEEARQETARRRAGAYQAAMEAVFAIPIAMGIGWWVDRKLGSEPIGLFVGLAFGFATFIVRLTRMRGLVEREAAEAERQKERSE